MTTSTELVPFKGVAPQYAPQYSVSDERQYPPQKYQSWMPETTQTQFVSNSEPTGKR